MGSIGAVAGAKWVISFPMVLFHHGAWSSTRRSLFCRMGLSVGFIFLTQGLRCSCRSEVGILLPHGDSWCHSTMGPDISHDVFNPQLSGNCGVYLLGAFFYRFSCRSKNGLFASQWCHSTIGGGVGPDLLEHRDWGSKPGQCTLCISDYLVCNQVLCPSSPEEHSRAIRAEDSTYCDVNSCHQSTSQDWLACVPVDHSCWWLPIGLTDVGHDPAQPG